MNVALAHTTTRSAMSPPEQFQVTAEELRLIMAEPEAWVSDKIAQFVLGIPRGTLRRFRHENRGPRYRKCGARVCYRIRWLLEYIEQGIVETSDSRKPQEAT